MAKVDAWTDERVERVVKLLQIAEGIITSYRNPAGHSWRPVTLDRWLTDVRDFLGEMLAQEEVVHEEAAVD